MSSEPNSAEEAVEIFLARRRGGESLDAASFAADHPGLEPELSSALRALLALESATGAAGSLDPSVPDRIGAYRVVRELGRGGMGVVLEAVEDPLGRRVALKVLPPELLASPSARARFRREAELASRLDHSGIATIYGAGVEDERPWIAMRFIEGRTLARAISESRSEGGSCLHLAPAATKGREAALRVAELVARVARALHSAHEQGVVHRDIKPSNIIVQPDGSPVLLDFGLAIEPESDAPSLTRTGEAPGTPAYLAPEGVSGELPRPDVQSDVYALGVTLYECLALRRPFDAPTPAALYRAILAGAPTGLRTLNASASRDLAVVTATAMERDRSRRYRSASALADDLEACVAGRPIAARPVPFHGRLLRWTRREPRLATAIAAAIVIAIGGLLWVSIVQAAASRAVAQKNTELSATNSSLATAKTEAEANARVATQKADDVLSLSAIQELQDLVDRANQLWPADPRNMAKYEEWLRDARALIEGRPADLGRGLKARPGLADHERKLAELEARALPASEEEPSEPTPEPGTSPADLPSRRNWTFADGEDRWWHTQLTELVADLHAFADPEAGLFSSGISTEHGWGVRKRLEFARTVADRSVEGLEARKSWEEAIAAIADSPEYGGLKLTPQLGLLPLGPDPESRLWEFAHLQTGAPAVRGEDGHLILRDETGLVFVLIPGGSFWMGAQKADSSGDNYDSQAENRDWPVREVTLDAHFLSKYEMTQGQWRRIEGRNPSFYPPGSASGIKTCGLLCPVEQTSWTDCMRVLECLDLGLPTEAQWEYGARAGTTSPWWTGDEKETLQGAANLADSYCKSNGGPSNWPYEDWLDDGWTLHAPVGTFRANAFGLHDVIGNVWEWCRDGYGDYDEPVRPGDGERQVIGASGRALRGGAFIDVARLARSAGRGDNPPNGRNGRLGLRPARGIPGN